MSRMIVGVAILLAGAPLGAQSPAPPLRQIQAIPLEGVEGRIDHMAADSKNQRLYLAALGNNTVEVIDLEHGKRVGQIKDLQEPQGICVLPDTHRIVVASGQDGMCRIYDPSLALLGAVGDLDDADNVRYDAGAKEVYVGFGKGGLAVIDPQRKAHVVRIDLGGHPESFQLESKGKRIFANVPSKNQVVVIDREEPAIVATWQLSDAQANFPMALDEDHHRLMVGCRRGPKLLVLDTDTGKAIAEVPCCQDTDDLFYDGQNRRVYVSGGEGRVDVFEQTSADHYKSIARVPTAPGARTSLFVAERAKLYVAAPRRENRAAQILVFEVVPRSN